MTVCHYCGAPALTVDAEYLPVCEEHAELDLIEANDDAFEDTDFITRLLQSLLKERA